MGVGKKKQQQQEKYATEELGAPVNDGRRRPQPRKAAVPVQHGGKGRKTDGYRTDAAREVALMAEREQQMRVAARQQAMAHARAMARARNQSKVIKQTRASFNAADAAAAAAESATERTHPSVAGEHSSPIHRPESPNPGAPGSAARGFRHPSNRRSPSAAQTAGTQASPPALTVDEASRLLPAGDSIGGSGGGTGLTFVEELDLAAARLERMGSTDGETRVLAQQQQQLKQERDRAEARQQPPRGSHNSRDLSAPTAWELCIKNSELTMDEDEDQIGMGGTGTVYKALWCGAPVAVKKIYYGDDHDHDPASLESLKKEADILATLRHPNIVRVCISSPASPCVIASALQHR